MGRVVHGGLGVVGRVAPAAAALRDAAVGVGEVVLIFVFGHAEGPAVAPALGLAVFASRLLVVVVAAPAVKVRLPRAVALRSSLPSKATA